jgi:putative Holliday junction resolvase
MRILAVDPGEKRIGLALSDPSGILAAPLLVLAHVARKEDAARIVRLASQYEAERILVGQALDDEGNPSPSGRKAARLADAIREQTSLPVELWDESLSTQDARSMRLGQGAPRSRRKGHLDDLAAAVFLQTYLDAHLPANDSKVE